MANNTTTSSAAAVSAAAAAAAHTVSAVEHVPPVASPPPPPDRPSVTLRIAHVEVDRTVRTEASLTRHERDAVRAVIAAAGEQLAADEEEGAGGDHDYDGEPEPTNTRHGSWVEYYIGVGYTVVEASRRRPARRTTPTEWEGFNGVSVARARRRRRPPVE